MEMEGCSVARLAEQLVPVLMLVVLMRMRMRMMMMSVLASWQTGCTVLCSLPRRRAAR